MSNFMLNFLPTSPHLPNSWLFVWHFPEFPAWLVALCLPVTLERSHGAFRKRRHWAPGRHCASLSPFLLILSRSQGRPYPLSQKRKPAFKRTSWWELAREAPCLALDPGPWSPGYWLCNSEQALDLCVPQIPYLKNGGNICTYCMWLL